jgi:hypothetical protein
MQPINPSTSNYNKKDGPLRQAQSVFKALNGSISLAQPVGTNASGIYNKFIPDNGDGVMLRVGGSASSETIKWTGSNVGLAINHGLQRQPIGFYVVDKDATCDVYRIGTPNTNTITLACTVGTVNTTIYIF